MRHGVPIPSGDDHEFDDVTALRDQPYGQLVFATVAIGLLAFGVFGLIEAGFRRLGNKR